MEIDLQNGLFMCPVYYECDPCDANGLPLPLDEPDYLLHFTENAAKLLNAGSRLFCLDDLPAEARVMFVLRYWSDLSIKEIAAHCDVGQSKVKMTLLRTRNALKTYLEKEGLR